MKTRKKRSRLAMAFRTWDRDRRAAQEGLSYKLLVSADAAGFHVRVVGHTVHDLDHDRMVYRCVEPVGSVTEPSQLGELIELGLARVRVRNGEVLRNVKGGTA